MGFAGIAMCVLALLVSYLCFVVGFSGWVVFSCRLVTCCMLGFMLLLCMCYCWLLLCVA